MHKIFADFNNSDRQGRIRLNTCGSLADLERLGDELRNGLDVILDDHDELKMNGSIEFSEEENIWVAIVKNFG